MVRLIIAILGATIAGAIFFMYTRPTYDHVQAIRVEIKQYDEALKKAAELQERKQTLLSRYNAFNLADIERLQKLLPDHVDNVRLILDMDSLANSYGLALQNVDVSVPDTASGSGEGSVGVISAGNQKYNSLTLTFSTTGTYDNFIKFLEDLESSLRIVDLVSLNVASVGAVGRELRYSYNVTLRTYWLK